MVIGEMHYQDGQPTSMRSKHFLAVIVQGTNAARLCTRIDLHGVSGAIDRTRPTIWKDGGLLEDFAKELRRLVGIERVSAKRYEIHVERGEVFQWEGILPHALELADAWVEENCDIAQ